MKLPALTSADRRIRLTEKATEREQLSPELENALRNSSKADRAQAIAASGASPTELRMAAQWLGSKGKGWKVGGMGLLGALWTSTIPSTLATGTGAFKAFNFATTAAASFLAVNSVVNRVQSRGLKKAMLEAANQLEAQPRAVVASAAPSAAQVAAPASPFART